MSGTLALTWALPKGRILDEAGPLLEAAGLDLAGIREAGRQLVVPLGEGHRGLLLKPWDVATYVELGVADVGFVGSDVLREREPDVYEPLDLKLGACRLVVAAPEGTTWASLLGMRRKTVRVASKYPDCARRFFAEKGVGVDAIKLYGSVELGAVTGLCDVVVDIVSSGKTLVENKLVELETIEPVSSRLVVNRAAWVLKAQRMRTLIEKIERRMEEEAQV